jgi:hypothetical protein
MKAEPVHLFFFRGLSTYGVDHAKWSIFDFGPMYKHFAQAFSEREIIFHPVTGMGAGSVTEVVGRAHDFFRSDPVWNSGARVHFAGHSAGGLVARLVVDRLRRDPVTPPGKITSLLTIATPHFGSQLAQRCVDMPVTYPGSVRLLRAFGYDIASKAHFFRELTPDGVVGLFTDSDLPSPSRLPVHHHGIRLGSIICASPRQEWCPPLRLIYKLQAFNELKSESDGIVEKEAQSFGQVLAEIPIDHFRQIGLFGKRWLFDETCDVAAKFLRESQA